MPVEDLGNVCQFSSVSSPSSSSSTSTSNSTSSSAAVAQHSSSNVSSSIVNGAGDHYHFHSPQFQSTTINGKLKQKSVLQVRFHRIHKHCLTCIKPLKCLRKPNYYNGLKSTEELYSLILNANYQDHHHHHHKLLLNGEVRTKLSVPNGKSKNGLEEDAEDAEEEEEEEDSTVEICPVVKCINEDCNVITHYCKLEEHYLMCQFQKVTCLNIHYGCPFMVLRKDIAQHLKHCPANVVHCSYEWNRWPLHTTEKQSPCTRLFCPPQSLDINNLDVSLALRDQRMLKQLRSATRQMKRIMRGCLSTHPAVPIKPYIGIRTYREYTTTVSYPPESQSNSCTDDNPDQSSQSPVPTVVVHCANIAEEKYVQYAHKLVDEAYHQSLMTILKEAAKFYRLSAQKFSLENSYPARKKSNSICQMTLTATGALATIPINHNNNNNNNGNESFLLSTTTGNLPSSSSINLPVFSDLERFPLSSNSADTTADKTLSTPPPPPPPIPKCNTLSLEIPIRSLAFFQPKPRAMYTFRCGLDFRRDECASHYLDIHSHIHGGLDGWIEHRCPLFQYGCNFVHRRWSPNKPGAGSRNTLIYNEVLETFACNTLPVSAENVLRTTEDNNDGMTTTTATTNDPCLNSGVHHLSESGSCQSSSTSLDPDSTEFPEHSNGHTSTCPVLSCSGKHCPSSTSSVSSPTSSPSSYPNHNHHQQQQQPSPHHESLSTLSLLSSCSLSSTSTATQNDILVGSESFDANHQSLPQPPPPPLHQFSLNDFPFEILQNICYYLDGYSLNNLSFTSHRFRAVVQSFLKRKGFVLLQWIRFQTDDGKHTWRATHKKWQFSTAISPIEGWSLDSTNVIGQHLLSCPFNQRHYRTEPFPIMLPTTTATGDTPMSLQCKKEL